MRLNLNLLTPLLAPMIAVCVATPAFATTVFVNPVEFRGALTDEAGTVTDLLKNAVERTKGFESVESAAAAQITLNSRLLKLGSSYLINLRKTAGGVASAELKVQGMDDMHLATQRLVRSVLTGSDEAPRIGEVTEADVHVNDKRIQSVRAFQLGFGPAWTSNLRDSGPASVWSLGYSWGIEQDFEILLMGEYLSSTKSSNASFSGLEIGVNYFFMRNRNSPFVNFDFGYGWASAASDCSGLCRLLGPDQHEDVNGWELGAGLGYKFFRTSSVNLAIVARHDYLMIPTKEGLPSKTSLKVVLYF